MPRLFAEPRPPATTRRSRALGKAGRLLYGQNYLIPLATLLDVNPKTIRRWLDGGEIPDRAWETLRDACAERGNDFEAFAVTLGRYLK